MKRKIFDVIINTRKKNAHKKTLVLNQGFVQKGRCYGVFLLKK